MSTTRKDATRDRDARILRAATELFTQNGFEATRMAEVASRAGVAVGTIYLRFATKHDLLVGILSEFEQRFAAAMSAPHIANLPWPDRFTAMFDAIMATAAAHPEVPRIMQLASHAEADSTRPDGFHPGAMIREVIAGIAERAQREQQFRADLSPRVIAAIAYGMVEGAMEEMMREPTPLPEAYVSALADAAARWLLVVRQ